MRPRDDAGNGHKRLARHRICGIREQQPFRVRVERLAHQLGDGTRLHHLSRVHHDNALTDVCDDTPVVREQGLTASPVLLLSDRKTFRISD